MLLGVTKVQETSLCDKHVKPNPSFQVSLSVPYPYLFYDCAMFHLSSDTRSL